MVYLAPQPWPSHSYISIAQFQESAVAWALLFQPLREAVGKPLHQWAAGIAPGFWICPFLTPPPSLAYRGCHIFGNELLCIKTFNLHKALGRIGCFLVSSDLIILLFALLRRNTCFVSHYLGFLHFSQPNQIFHSTDEVLSKWVLCVFDEGETQAQEHGTSGDKHCMGRLNTSKE